MQSSVYRIISIFSKKAYIHRRLGGNYTNTLMGEFQLFLFSVTFDVFLLVSMDYFYNENENMSSSCLLTFLSFVWKLPGVLMIGAMDAEPERASFFFNRMKFYVIIVYLIKTIIWKMLSSSAIQEKRLQGEYPSMYF